MSRRLILCWIISFPLLAIGRAPGTSYQLKTELQKVTMKSLVEWVNLLIKASQPSRMVGLPGHDKARDFLRDTILSLDPKSSGKLTITSNPPQVDLIKKFYQDDFNSKIEGKLPPSHPDYKKWSRFTQFMVGLADSRKSVPIQNIIWEKAGLNPKKTLIVTAHYDTISHDKTTLLVNEKEPMPGANYNASGVAVALGLLKVLANIDLNYSVKIVFLDWQGIGFHGSEHLARELKAQGGESMGVVNLEMIGQDTSYFDKTKQTGNMSLYLRNDQDEARFARTLMDQGSRITQKVRFEPKANGFENSDHIRFWEQGFKAVTFSQNWEEDFNPKFYQTAQDSTETLNHETLWHAYQYVGGAVIGTLLDLTK